MSTNEHDFLFASLDSKPPPTARKVHIRRLYDVLQLCIQRQDYARAKRAWAILVRCKEVRWKSLWTIGLLLVGDNADMSGNHEEKVDYLRSLMLHHLNDVSIFNPSLLIAPHIEARSDPHRISSMSRSRRQTPRSI
ncbi:hypothetical protein M378DRAFT_156290, partial [Amanita muscaria Koide BX008]